MPKYFDTANLSNYVGVRRLELPTSTSRTWRAANCATPRGSIPYAELRCKGKYYFCISPRKTNVIFSLRFAYQGIKIKTPKVFDFRSFLCCLGRTRTLTNGTRIRCATITPQGNLRKSAVNLLSLLFYECKGMDYFYSMQIVLHLFLILATCFHLFPF